MIEELEVEFSSLFPNTQRLKLGEKEIFLVGTAHISQKSVEEVQKLIQTIQPDSVCVELCATRFQTMKDQSSWQKLDLFQVIKQGKTLFLVANLALSSFQKKMGDQFGVRPGAEQITAIHQAEAQGAQLVLADRDVQATLKRSWAAIPWYKKMTVLGGLLESMWAKVEISEEELEKLKDQDQLSKLMDEFAAQLPEVKKPLIEERDIYLAGKISQAPGQKIVAVVGAGHVRGIEKHLSETHDLSALEIIPKPSSWGKVLKWVIPALVLCAFYFGYQKHAGESFEDMLWAWILPNSILAMLFSLMAGSKLLSALTAFVASPITSLNPTLGAGMIVGLVEAWLRKPKVEDMARLPEDTTSLRGWYRNPVTRTLMVALFSTIGSALGAIIGLSWLFAIWAK
ncbi:MAG: TraB/GumN family protein [Acidobacteria bacterium]|nr:TraB/GumN family protein [Acidobacteriota bacterium]MCB9396423.1 TraB/GumN family protein [Acidobacteriota bacterium]